MKQGSIHIGTSGWHYKHWRDVVYPPGLPESKQFAHYRTLFDTVEINNSFYKLPAADTFTSWRKEAKKDFRFAVKASRFITHMKKLKMEAAELDLFFSHVCQLKPRLGPILFQLPPRWKVNLDRLEKFLSILPRGYRYAFEFRNETWYIPEVYSLLRKRRCAFCIYELGGHRSPEVLTSDVVYVRLHGPSAQKYQDSYTTAQLRGWARRCIQWKSEGKNVYLYFDNDQAGYAARNAQELNKLIEAGDNLPL